MELAPALLAQGQSVVIGRSAEVCHKPVSIMRSVTYCVLDGTLNTACVLTVCVVGLEKLTTEKM